MLTPASWKFVIAGTFLVVFTMAYAAASSGSWWHHALNEPVVVTSFLNV